MSQYVNREHNVKSVGIETDEDWGKPERRAIPKLADLEVAAMEAGAELDAVISAANSNEYARERLNRIYAFVYHAVRTDPEGFAARTKVRVKAGVAYAPYLRPTKHIFNAVLNDRRCGGADIAGGLRNSISRYAKVFAWAGENGIQPKAFLSFLNDNGGIHGVEQSYHHAHDSRKNDPNDADKATLAKAKEATGGDGSVAPHEPDGGSVAITLSADEVRLIRTLLAKQPQDVTVSGLLIRLEAMFPTQRKLELFSRRNRPGWETWGSEAGKLDPSQDNASVPADKPSEAFPPAYLTSLHGVSGKKRLTALTRHVPEDECYTEQDLMACGLKAAGRTHYDVDVCTMNSTGTYPAATGKRRTVDGKTVEARFTGVPAHRHYTKNSSQWGSLDLPWCGDLVWCNPPYGDRLWATFMEKANHEVEVGNAGVVVCVTNASGADLTCWANGVVLTANAFEIRLEATDLPFFKDHKGKVESNKGTRFVLYGKGEGFRAYVLRFIDEVERAGYVGGAWAERLRSQARTIEVAPAPTNQFDAMAAKAHKTQGGGMKSRKDTEAAFYANHHPALKPVDLMRWLVRLVTPEGGLVLDPFMGSGTTGIATGLEGRQFVGIECEAEYCEIAKARLGAWATTPPKSKNAKTA